MSQPQPILSMQNIAKNFGGVKALRGINFDLERGEIHALVGENGAGKSTLMKILSGFYPHGTFEGAMSIQGRSAQFENIKASEAAGIAIIHQELALVPQLSIAENIFLGQECKNNLGLIDWELTFQKAKHLLAQTGLKKSVQTLIQDCSVAEQQLVEITRALARDAQILILDEPTAALTEHESQRLLERLRQLQANGVSSIYISHRLHEVMQIADRVTVLRDGQTVGTYRKADLTEPLMVKHMVGRDLSERFPQKQVFQGKRDTFTVKHWSVRSLVDGKLICKDISFEARQGEVLGFAGLAGSGRSELFMNLFRLFGSYVSGEMELHGQPLHLRNADDAHKAGLALVTEDRKHYGLVLDMSIAQNASLASLDQFTRFNLIDDEKIYRTTQALSEKLKIKTPSLEQKVGFLSGGNQQKVVLAKCLMLKPKVLILDEPTRGIDVGARFEIYKIMHQLVAEGVIVIMVSSDLQEILGLSDRILVFHEGQLSGELTGEEATQEKIMSLATGQKTN